MEISKEQQILLGLLKENMNGSSGILPETLLRGADWNAVLTEAVQQSVVLQAFDAVAAYRSRLPAEVYQAWFQKSMRVMQSNLRVQRAEQALVSLLAEHGYPYVILKGSAAAAYYPRPDLRAMGDVDFLIRSGQKDEIGALLEASGYENCHHDNRCHSVYRKSGAVLEMHVEPAGIPLNPLGDKLRTRLAASVFDRCCLSSIGSLVPDPSDHGLILLLHMQHHILSKGLGLRHMCDWAAFVQKTKGDAFWSESLLPFLKEIGLFHFAGVMTAFAAAYFGIPCPQWANAGPSAVEAVLGDILASGNFGRKERTRAKAGTMISYDDENGLKHGVVWNLYHTLHRATSNRYPCVAGHPLRHFFADVFYALRYCVLVLCGKRESVVEMFPHVLARKSVYEQLRIFETE